MRYCINPNCEQRNNQDNDKICRICGTSLILEGRFEVLDKISNSPPDHPWEVFNVRDIESSNLGEYKILKTLKEESSDCQRLFTYEKKCLQELQNPNIPKYVIDFDIPAEGKRPKLDCLVMELIEGQDLTRWLATNRKLELEDRKRAVKWLQKITMILDYIHSKNCIHRDIKPSNIILGNNDKLAIIDFGIAREINTNVRIQGARTRAYTDSYAAPEQLDLPAKAYHQSDFFALGKTFVHLLTGNIPEQGVIKRSDWESNTELRNTGIIPLIDWLLAPNRLQRPQTANQILKVLQYIDREVNGSYPDDEETEKFINRIKNKQNPIKKAGLSIAALLAILSTVGIAITQCHVHKDTKIAESPTPSPTTSVTSTTSPATPEESKAEDLINFGESNVKFFGDLGSAMLKGKKDAIKLFNEGQKDPNNYKKAFEAFKNLYTIDPKSALEHPEIAIFMNNAKVRYLHSLRENKLKPIYKVVAVSPIENETGQHILYGVALKQQLLLNSSKAKPKDNDINNPPEIYLEIGIADDANNEKKAENISITLKNLKNIIAVVGHYSTEATKVALKNYCDGRLAIVSPTASATGLSDKCQQNKDVFFRVVSSTQIEAKAWVNFLNEQKLIESSDLENIIVFYKHEEKNPGFSQNLLDNLKNTLGEKKLSEKNIFDLSSKELTPDKYIKKINESSLIFLIPNGKNNDDGVFKNALNVLDEINKSNQKKPKYILGSNPLYSTFNVKPERLQYFANRLKIAIDWYHDCNSTESLHKDLRDFAGGDSDRRTAAAYEALQAISSSLLNNKDAKKELGREDVIKGLKLLNLESEAFKDKHISFNKNGDRKDIKDRVWITPNDRGNLYVNNDQCKRY